MAFRFAPLFAALGLALAAAPAASEPARAGPTEWLVLKPAPKPPAPGTLSVRFYGVTTLLLDDGDRQILVDGFFSRPRKRSALAVQPDLPLIRDALHRAKANRLAAVLVAHAHIDHGMDSADVARESGAVLYGSPSVLKIAEGRGLPGSQMKPLADRDVLTFGRFTVTVFETPHSPKAFFKGTIRRPLKTPTWIGAYRSGEANFSFLVEHDGQKILIHPSANFRPGAYKGRHVDVVFLGIGTLGKRKSRFVDDYWREVVGATGPAVVAPIHWDDFTLPLSRPLKWAPAPLDDVPNGLAMLADRADRSQVPIRFPPLCDPVALPLSTAPAAARTARMTPQGWSDPVGASCPAPAD